MSLFESSKNVVIHGGTLIAQRMESTLGGFDLLASKALPSAFHMADADSSHSTCHPNTRTRILQQIKDWVNPKIKSDSFIMWLHGAAGGGKTAIGRTIAKWCEKEGILLGEFFFSRADGVRGHIGSLVATLAYRMATLTLSAAKKTIVRVVTRDPHIFSASLADQMKKLVLEPLKLEAPCGIVPHVIILDGLDECLSADEQDLVLDVISGTLHTFNPELRILIFSRPEPTISTAFNASPLQDISTRISLSDDIDSDADIRLFLADQFTKLKQQLPHLPSGEWPTAAEITRLVEKSSGQFIFAATVVKYVCSPRHRHNAVTRLKHVLDLPPNAKQHPFAELDALYTFILSTRELEEVETTVKAAAVCLEHPKYFNTTSPKDLAKVLQLELIGTQAMLDELASLFEVSVNNIRTFHASFGDYLYDESRSGNFYCNRGDILAETTCAYLRQGRDRDVLSFHAFVRLLEDVSPTQGLQNVLNQIDPSSIFNGDPFNGESDIIDAYYLIPLLRQLQNFVSSEVNKKFVSYFDQEFKSHITGLFKSDIDMLYLSTPSDSSDNCSDFNDYSDSDDSDCNADLPQAHSKGLLIRQAGEEDTSDEDGHNTNGGVGSRPGCSGKPLNPQAGKENLCNKGDHNSESGGDSSPSLGNYEISKLVLLSASRAWDRVVISAGLHIPPSHGQSESFKSLCDEAPFVRSHMPKTFSVLLNGQWQAQAALFCLEQITERSTTKDLLKVFTELLPNSLLHATQFKPLVTAINELFKNDIYKRLPSETQKAITNYISLYQPSPTTFDRPSSTSQRPLSTLQTKQSSTAPRPLSTSQQSSVPSRTQRPSSSSHHSSTTSRTQQPSGASENPSLSTSSQIQRPSSVSQSPSTVSQTQQPPSATPTASRTQQPSNTSQEPSATSQPPSTAPKGPSGTSHDPQSTPRNPPKSRRRER